MKGKKAITNNGKRDFGKITQKKPRLPGEQHPAP
jgi:hypothetical protein